MSNVDNTEVEFLRAQWGVWHEIAERQRRCLLAIDIKLVGYQDPLADDLRRMIREALDMGENA